MKAYSALDKLFHRIVLSSNCMNEALFDLEKFFFLAKIPQYSRKNVFITGCARAGTTALLQAIYASKQFASLTYRDMPMVIAPNFWRCISQKFRKHPTQEERAHGDRIMVDYNSPEALEEIFWRVFHGDDYIRDEVLVPHEISDNIQQKFFHYLALICSNYSKIRYLSKNNNNILRLGSLASSMRESVFLLPFRHPLEQAASLLRQHSRFDKECSFTADYMKWLCHFEFGVGHRPFCLKSESREFTDLSDIHYWLETWNIIYRHLVKIINISQGKIFLVSYTKICTEPQYWKKLCDVVEIPHAKTFAFSPSKRDTPVGISKPLLKTSLGIYEECQKLSLLRQPLQPKRI